MADFTRASGYSNIWLPADPGSPLNYADAIINIAADSRMGDDGDQNDTAYYADGIHPNATGYGIIASYAANAVLLFLRSY